MQTRRMIVALFAAMAVFYLWLLVAPMVMPRSEAPSPEEAPSGTTASGTGGSRPATATRPATSSSPSPVVATGPGPATMQARAGQATVTGGSDNTPIVLGNAGDGSAFPMALEINPLGASVSRVAIRGHYETVKEELPYRIIEPVKVSDEQDETGFARSFVTRFRFEDLKLDAALNEATWKVVERGEERVVLSVDISAPDGQPLARVFKRYELEPQSLQERTCDLGLSLKIENVSGRSLQAILIQQGPIGFKREQLRGEDRNIVYGYWENGRVESDGYQRRKVFKRGRIELGGDDDQGNRVAWVSEGNKYFACIMAPAGRNSPDDKPSFARAEAIHLTDVKDGSGQERQDLTFQYITHPLNIASGEAAEVAFDCYVGPKSRGTFEAVEVYRQRDYYAAVRESFYFCAPGALVGVMMTLLNAFHALWPHNYGVAIVILVLIVRGLLHPITKKSQVNMMKMQKNTARLQPRIQATKEKYANDRAKMNQAIMEIYREEGINPAGNLFTCLPMFLQIPIWGALWTALAYTIEMRHAPFDGRWIKDLTQPDALITFAGPGIRIPIISFIMNGPLQALNLLPILLGLTQVLQARFMPRGNPSAQSSGNPDQLGQQRKMMMFMSVFFVFILYNAPSGLTLYIMASNLFGILEQWRIRQHLAEAEKKGEQGAPASRAKDKPAGKTGDEAPRRKSWVQKKWEGLQKQAEAAKRIESQRKKGKARG